MNKSIFLPLAVATLLCGVSCEKVSTSSQKALRFSVSTTGTKAAIVNNSALQTNGNKFSLDAWLEAKNRKIHTMPVNNFSSHYIDSAEVALSGSTWSGTNLFWCDRVQTNFWATYPRENVVGRSGLTWPKANDDDNTDANQKTPSFTYDMSSYASSSKDVATKTKDLLVGYARGMWNEEDKSGGTIKIQFEHALSAICYKMGAINSGYSFKEIAISGIQYKGTCNLTGFTSGIKDTVSISWKFQSAKPADSLSFAQTISGTPAAGSQMLGDNYIFFIPQTLGSMATISALLDRPDPKADTTVTVEISGYDWNPGRKYEYTLSYDEKKSELIVLTTEYKTADGTWTD